MQKVIKPPKSWKDLSTYHIELLSTEWYKRISYISSTIVKTSFKFFDMERLDYLLAPVTTGSTSSPMGLGSDSKPVSIQLYGVPTYLADSMQFLLELGCRMNPNGCFYIAPSFRGEQADNRHLCQFFHAEAEIIGTLEDIIQMVERYIRFLAREVLEINQEDILRLAGTVDHITRLINSSSIPRCTFDNAVDILQNDPKYIELLAHDARSITPLGEQVLMQHFGGIVWITEFDYLTVPFYQKAKPPTMRKALHADLLMGIGETVGAGERNVTAVELSHSLKLHNISPRAYKWYIDMKEQAPLQTSGFGLGIERFILWLIRHDDIRDIQLIPRFNGIKPLI